MDWSREGHVVDRSVFKISKLNESTGCGETFNRKSAHVQYHENTSGHSNKNSMGSWQKLRPEMQKAVSQNIVFFNLFLESDIDEHHIIWKFSGCSRLVKVGGLTYQYYSVLSLQAECIETSMHHVTKVLSFGNVSPAAVGLCVKRKAYHYFAIHEMI